VNKDELNNLSKEILDSSIEVHRNLGPGLLESVYEICLEDELKSRNISVKRQVTLPIIYKGRTLSKEFCIDLFVEDEIIVELKTVEHLLPIHEAQLLTYLKLANKKLGLLINFNEVLVKKGFRRLLNGNLPEL
jgi:GxxExxY protein